MSATTALPVNLAKSIAGTLGYPSKMPGTAYGIPAAACHVGAKLLAVPDSVCSGCYALKGKYGTLSVQVGQARRIAGLDNPRWVDAMVTMLRRAHGLDGGKVHASVTSPGWHRWHDSGDIQSVEHLAKIADVARATPELSHWLPTREVSILAAYRKAGLTLPGNLTVRVSATMIDGPATKAFPLTSRVHDKFAPADGAHVCPAPSQGGVCGSCRACWSADVAQVSYHRH